GIYIKDSKNIHITGTGDSKIFYGIEVKNSGISIVGRSEGTEIDHVEVYGTHLGIYGRHTAGHRSHIHHNYIHDIGHECIYIGSSHWKKKKEDIHSVKIHHNRVENCRYDGIQLGSCRKGCKVHHNYIKNIGTSKSRGGKNNKGNGGHGLVLNFGSSGSWTNNVTINTKQNGMVIQGNTSKESYKIKQNVFVNSNSKGLVLWSGKGKVCNNVIVKSAVEANKDIVKCNTFTKSGKNVGYTDLAKMKNGNNLSRFWKKQGWSKSDVRAVFGR
ncbi:MAG: hypothetical protein AAF629_30860, partial [Chloroflexota bacterium]